MGWADARGCTHTQKWLILTHEALADYQKSLADMQTHKHTEDWRQHHANILYPHAPNHKATSYGFYTSLGVVLWAGADAATAQQEGEHTGGGQRLQQSLR